MPMKRLFHSGLLDQSTHDLTEIPNQLRKRARLVYVGDFESADGPVSVTEEMLHRLASNHNTNWSKMKRLFTGKDVPVGHGQPMQLDHTRSGWDTIGRFTGELSVEDFMDPADEQTKKGLFGDVLVLGRENVERVLDGRWANLSIGADFDAGKFHELTVTPFPAAESATILSKPDETKDDDNNPGEPKMKFHLMKKRTERYFKLSKKMSDEDADKELKRLEESTDEEELKRLAEEMDDDDEKKEKEKKEKDDQLTAAAAENTTKLTAAKANITKLSTDFRSAMNGAQLKAKTATIYHKLSAIRASGRITPAEIKKMNVVELAGKPDDTITTVLKAYEDRQPVIMVGQIGSMRTLTHEEIMDKHKKVEFKGAPISRLEARMRYNHGRISKDEYDKLEAGFAKLEGGGESAEDVVNIHVDTDPHADYAAMEGEYTSICGMIDQNNGNGAKDALKKLMERFKSRGAYGMAEPAMHDSSSEQLTALQKDITDLTAKFDEAIGLAQSLAGGM